MYTTITKEFGFSAAHRIEGHPKCGRLHGHNYKVIVELGSELIPEDGMIIDYGYIKQIIQPIIDGLDHRYMYGKANMEANDPLTYRDDIVALPIEHTTAEHLAEYFIGIVKKVLTLEFSGIDHREITVVSVTVKETDSTSAVCYG